MAPSSTQAMQQQLMDCALHGEDGLNDANDDWVSLLFHEPALDLEADLQVDPVVSLASLSNFPLSDFENTELDSVSVYGSFVLPNSGSTGFLDMSSSQFHETNLSNDPSLSCITSGSSSQDAPFDGFTPCFDKGTSPKLRPAVDPLLDFCQIPDLGGTKLSDQSHLPIHIVPSTSNSPNEQRERCTSMHYSTMLPNASLSVEGPPSNTDSAALSQATLPQLRGTPPVSFSHGSPESDLTQGSNEPYIGLDGEMDVNIEVHEGDVSGCNGASVRYFADNMGSEGATSGSQVGNHLPVLTVDSGSRESGTKLECPQNFTEFTCHGLWKVQAHSQRQCVAEDGRNVIAPTELNRKRKALDRKSRSSTPEDTMGDSSKTRNNEDGDAVGEEDEQRKLARLMRNRESAQLSRQRKKAYVDELEERIKTMASTIAELNNTISLISAENINLRRQLGFFCQPPTATCGKPGGVPMAIPWVPYPTPAMGGRYMGASSQVPLVPIPRLKSQQTVVRRLKKSKLDGQQDTTGKAAKRTKKAAGVAVVGLFFFMVLLLPFNWSFLGLKMAGREEGGLLPGRWGTGSGSIVARGGGRVLTSWNEEGSSFNRTSTLEEPQNLWADLSDSKPHLESEHHAEGRSEFAEKGLTSGNARDKWHGMTGCARENKPDAVQPTGSLTSCNSHLRNTSELAAILFVPRNGTLVKIDGNLIIHSVLAGEKAGKESSRPSINNEEFKRNMLDERVVDGKGLALAADLRTVGVKVGKEKNAKVQDTGALVELRKALAAGAAIHSEQADGSLQELFVEGLAGPVLSSGMCTEVFQFETSATSSSTSASTSELVDDVSAASSRKANDYMRSDKDGFHDQGPRRAGRQFHSRRKRNPYAVPLPPARKQVTLDGDKKQRNETTFTQTAHTIREEEFRSKKVSPSSLVVSVLAGPPEFGDEAIRPGGSTGLSQIFVVILIDSVKYVTYSCMLPSKGSQPQFVTS